MVGTILGYTSMFYVIHRLVALTFHRGHFLIDVLVKSSWSDTSSTFPWNWEKMSRISPLTKNEQSVWGTLTLNVWIKNYFYSYGKYYIGSDEPFLLVNYGIQIGLYVEHFL